MDLTALQTLPPEQIRILVPQFLSGFIDDAAASGSNLERIEGLFQNRSDDELQGMLETVLHIGTDHTLYRANPLCRELIRAWSRDVIPSYELSGTDHLASAMNAGPTILLGNHLSYYDTGALDVVLAWSGHAELANRVMAAAGPKVYAQLFRRFAASSLNTLPVPQSTSFEHTAEMSPRELARKALASVEAAHEAMGEGYALLLYGEGSRSRNTRLQPFLRAVHRYLAIPGAQIVPTAVWGTEHLFPVDNEHIRPAVVSLQFGAPISVADAGGTKKALEQSWQALSTLLPNDYAPEAGTQPLS